MGRVIFQPDRVLLHEQIRLASEMLSGVILDAGAGNFQRYAGLFRASRYVTCDVNASYQPEIIGDAQRLPFQEASFDGVICSQVLEHLPSPLLAVREFFRVLKPGGRLLLTVPQMNELHSEPYDFYRYTRYGITFLVQQSGFEVSACQQRGGFYVTLAQQVIRYSIDRFNLYVSAWYLLFKPLCALVGRMALLLDKWDTQTWNRKHTLGWLVAARKPGVAGQANTPDALNATGRFNGSLV